MIVTLPFPPSILSPNNHSHRMAKARAEKKYRNDCGFAAMASGVRRMSVFGLDVRVTFCPPIKPGPRMDDDNAVASFKAGRDGLADVLGVNDRHWSTSYEWGDPVKHGAVLVEIADA